MSNIQDKCLTVCVGIPTLSMGNGQFVNHTADWLREYSRDFSQNHYHQPSDEYHED